MLKSAGFTFIAKLLIAVLNFAVIIIISRYLGPADKGVCSWYLVLIAISLVFSEAIAGPAAGFLLLKHAQKNIMVVGYIWAVIPGFAVTIIFLALHKINSGEWLLLFLLCWLNAANSLHLHLMLGRRQFLWFNFLAVITPALVISCLLLFFYAGYFSTAFYLYSLLIAWGIAFVLGLIMCMAQTEEIQHSSSVTHLVRDGFRFGLANQASHLTGLLNNRLIFFILPAGLLGIYSNALSLAEATLLIPGSVGQVMYATLLNSKNPQVSKRVIMLNWWLCLALLLLVFFAVTIIPDAFYQAIFGNAFSGVKPYLVLLSASVVFYGCYLICSYWQSAHGRFINNFYATLAGLMVNALVSLIFYFFGIYTIYFGILGLASGFFTMFQVSLFQLIRKSGGAINFSLFPTKAEIVHFFKK